MFQRNYLNEHSNFLLHTHMKIKYKLLNANCLLSNNHLLNANCLHGCNHLLYANRLLSNNLVESGARLFLFLLLCDASLLFLPLHVAARISAAPLCVQSILLLTSVSKGMPQQS